MFKTLLFSIAFIFSLSASAAAQSTNNSNFPSPNKDREDSPLGSPEDELRQRAAIRHEEDSFKDNVERAKENAQLGAGLRASFKVSNALSRDDLKKLERMEKLARKIRSSAGGSDDDEQLKDPPQKLEAALVRLAELSEELSKNVEKSSRFVVSTSIIEHSNEMLELIRLIRTLTP